MENDIPLMLAKCSQVAYEGRQAFIDQGWDVAYQMSASHIRCSVFLVFKEETQTSVLVFRGTSGWADIWDDVRRFRIVTKDGWYIHAGFSERWYEIEAKVQKLLENCPKSSHFYVTGHSLGGALATLALIKGMPQRAIGGHTGLWPFCVTFGQPRVGGPLVAQAIDDLGITRYVNHGDVVARLPTIGYRHGGRELELPTWLDDKCSWYSFYRKHGIDSYVARLEKMQEMRTIKPAL